MNDPQLEKPRWKRITILASWLYLFPPVGLWKLYQDTTLSPSVKWRILIYLFLLPALLYLTVSVRMINRILQQLLP